MTFSPMLSCLHIGCHRPAHHGRTVAARSAPEGDWDALAAAGLKGARPPISALRLILRDLKSRSARFVLAGTITGVEISSASSISCTTFTCSGLDIDASGNLSAPSVVASGYLGGHNVTCGNSLTVDTSLVTVNGSAGITTTFQDKAGNTHNVVGGIITS
jgi:hypothetical protein